jgi:hypothetical protein
MCEGTPRTAIRFNPLAPQLPVTIPGPGAPPSGSVNYNQRAGEIMTANVKGKHVAIVATDGLEQGELKQPLDALALRL